MRSGIAVNLVAVLSLAIALWLAGFDPTKLAQATSAFPAVGLVVEFGDGTVATRCVAVDGQVSGYDLLLQSGLSTAASQDGLGVAVCGIDRVGCAESDCFCQWPPYYWSYWHLTNGQWRYSQVGASGYQVKAGDVEGWSWGEGEPPSHYTFDEICAAAPADSPTPLLPTRQPTSTAAPAETTPRPTMTSGPVIATTAPVEVEVPASAPTVVSDSAPKPGAPPAASATSARALARVATTPAESPPDPSGGQSTNQSPAPGNASPAADGSLASSAKVRPSVASPPRSSSSEASGAGIAATSAATQSDVEAPATDDNQDDIVGRFTPSAAATTDPARAPLDTRLGYVAFGLLAAGLIVAIGLGRRRRAPK